jgi:hypothetical protein
MTTRNIQELALAVMGLLSSNDIYEGAVGSQELAIITDRYTERMATLRFEGLVYWPDAAIPLEVFDAVTRIVAHEAARPLGEAIPEEQVLDGGGPPQQVGVTGMRMLRQHMRKHRSKLPTVGEYF